MKKQEEQHTGKVLGLIKQVWSVIVSGLEQQQNKCQDLAMALYQAAGEHVQLNRERERTDYCCNHTVV